MVSVFRTQARPDLALVGSIGTKTTPLVPPRALARLWKKPSRGKKPDVPMLEVIVACLFNRIKTGPSHS